VLSGRIGEGIPFGRAVQRRKDSGAAELEPLSVYLQAGVVPRSSRDDNHNRLGAELSNYLVVEPGDIVFNKLRTWQGGLGVSRHRGIVSPAYFVCRPSPDFEPRFLHYLLRSSPYLAEFTRISKFMPPSQFDIAWDDLRLVPVPARPLGEQRAIADFLDTETARIDALITKKRRMIDLLGEHQRNFVANAVTLGLNGRGRVVETKHAFAPRVASDWRLMRLRHVVREIVDTAHKTAPVVEDGEYLVVRTANVKSGRLVLDGAHFTDHDSWIEWTARGVPEAGDVIFTREAPAGEACLVPDELPLCIGQRTVLLRPSRDLISGAWLLHSLYSGPAQQFIEVLSRSTTVAHINMSDIPDIPIVVPPLAAQEGILKTIGDVTDRSEAISSRLATQLNLLQEHRQALITAAVTGELAVPGVPA
jgi:type I restriction enzyme S subunit